MPPRINYDLCNSCGICIFECGQDVYSYAIDKDRVAALNAKECYECFQCQVKCPRKAITVLVPAGKIEKEEVDNERI